MSKITMQDIADALDISRVSVWKVFNNQTGVSDALRETVMNKAKELGYIKAYADSLLPEEEKIVSLIVSRPDSSTFWTNIIHRVAQELSYHNINLMYTYVPTENTKDFILPPILTNGSVHGAIILNIYDVNLISLINELTIPKVFLDTVPQINNRMLQGDLFLIEGFSTVYEITASVIKDGYTKIGFIGDIQYAKTNLDRYDGYCRCMCDHNLKIDHTLCLTDNIGIFSYYQELSNFLDSLPELPQAFICVSDFVAHFIKLYFSEHSDRIVNGIVITGFDGSKEYANIDGLITTANVKTSLLGKRLALQIIYRMEHKDASYELIYINPPITYKESVIY